MSLRRADVERIAKETGVSASAVEAIASAMAHSEGASAQFNHPELGGMGQWMSGGMLMIGDMYNNELKAKVDRVCRAVAAAIVSLPSPERRSGNQASHTHGLVAARIRAPGLGRLPERDALRDFPLKQAPRYRRQRRSVDLRHREVCADRCVTAAKHHPGSQFLIL